mmetsp:Transcript_46809/g.99365  ORF Transcript_46809/g.99365 Transcript_46809/m.99365 type:complete len:255 (+) Transcript_46809:1560-2324(+)
MQRQLPQRPLSRPPVPRSVVDVAREVGPPALLQRRRASPLGDVHHAKHVLAREGPPLGHRERARIRLPPPHHLKQVDPLVRLAGPLHATAQQGMRVHGRLDRRSQRAHGGGGGQGRDGNVGHGREGRLALVELGTVLTREHEQFLRSQGAPSRDDLPSRRIFRGRLQSRRFFGDGGDHRVGEEYAALVGGGGQGGGGGGADADPGIRFRRGECVGRSAGEQQRQERGAAEARHLRKRFDRRRCEAVRRSGLLPN